MSVRAYKIRKLELEDRCSFNLWHDKELCEFLGVYDNTDPDNGGIVEVAVDVLEEALKTLNIEKDKKKALEKDIAEARAKNEDYILYYCF